MTTMGNKDGMMLDPANHENVVAGLWREHASGKLFVLVKEDTAVIVSIMVAIALTLSLPRAVLILKLIVLPKLVSMKCKARDEHFDEQSSVELDNVLENVGEALSIDVAPERVFLRILRDYICVPSIKLPSSSARPCLNISSGLSGMCNRFQSDRMTTTILFVIAFAFLTFFFGTQLIALYANQIIGSNLARSTNPLSGAWFPNIAFELPLRKDLLPVPPIILHEGTTIFATHMENFVYNKLMSMSTAYADECYKQNAWKEKCVLFSRNRIDYRETHNATCPFDSSICSVPAYELDTGFVDASVLGINDRHTCQFRIRKTCAPLATDERFVRSMETGDQGSRLVEYFYGDFDLEGNLTHEEVVPKPMTSSFDPAAKYLAIEFRGNIVDKPRVSLIPELEVPGGSVTLYLIRPVNIVYRGANDDPIFPAIASERAYEFPWYEYPHQHSTVLGCANTMIIRHPSLPDIEWQTFYQNDSKLEKILLQRPDVSSSLHILNLAYFAMNFFRRLDGNVAMNLNASQQIVSHTGGKLDSQQWKVEVKKMMDTQLALLQFTILGMAQGLGYSTHAQNILAEYGVSVDKKILSPAPGWKNIKVAELAVFLSVCVVLWIFTAHVGDVILIQWVWDNTVLYP